MIASKCDELGSERSKFGWWSDEVHQTKKELNQCFVSWFR